MELFISLQDPRQRPKGTRDPLGFEQIWTLYGREVVSGLTTITNSLDNFIVALLGFYLSGINETDNDEKMMNFIRYEQTVAYLRLHINRSQNILGITRAKNFKDTENMKVSIENQILSSQASYGLWGLYSTALADVSLIKNRTILEAGMKIIEIIKRNHKEVFDGLQLKMFKDTSIKEKYLNDYGSIFNDLLKDKDIKKELLSQLLSKSSIYNFMLENEITVKENNSNEKLINVKTFCENIYNNGSDEILKNKVDDIMKIDDIMKVGNRLFDTIRNSDFDGKSLESFTKKISNIQFPHLSLPTNTKNITYKDKIEKFADAMNSKMYRVALEMILDINKSIMGNRDSIPWIEVVNSKLKIRVKTHKPISDLENMKEGMEYNYFMYSYLNIAWQLKKIS